MSRIDPAILAPVAEVVGAEVGIEPWALMGQADKESGLNPTATNRGKYVGLMQIDKALVPRMVRGARNPFDPTTNMRAGARYLATLRAQFDGDRELALAAYNWGPGNVTKALNAADGSTWDDIKGEVPGSVRYYVARVTALAAQHKSLWR